MDHVILPELVRRESRSFLQYVRESYPWARSGDATVRDAILRIAQTEADFAARLAALLQKRHIPTPGLGAYPTSFTNSNFLSAAYLAPKLVAVERHTLAELERDLEHVTDDDFRGLLKAYRDLKRQNLGELEALAAAPPVVASPQPAVSG